MMINWRTTYRHRWIHMLETVAKLHSPLPPKADVPGGFTKKINLSRKILKMAEGDSTGLGSLPAPHVSQPHWHYQLFGQRLCSDLPLLASARSSFTKRDLAFRYVPPDDGGGLLFGDGRLLTGGNTDFGCILELYDTDHGILFRWRGLSDFLISGDGRNIHCQPSRGTGIGLVLNLLYSVILPFTLHVKGVGNLHASAVVLPGGAAGFIADPGAGKSTLAAAFAMDGYQFLTDDILAVKEGSQGIIACPGLPYVSLSSHSMDILFGPMNVPTPISLNGRKMRLPVEDLPMALSREPVLLKELFVLRRGGSEDAIKIELMPRVQALRCLLENTNCLSLLPQELLRSHMGCSARITASIPVYRLVYPSSLKHLPLLIESVLEHHHTVESPVTKKG